MSSSPPRSQRRAWWAPSGSGESARLPPGRLDVPAHDTSSGPLTATSPSTSTSTSSAWASALHHSQRTGHDTLHTPQRFRPPYTPISPPALLTDPRRAPPRDLDARSPLQREGERRPRGYDGGQPRQEYEGGHPHREYEGRRSSREHDVGRDMGRPPLEHESGRPPPEYETTPRPSRPWETAPPRREYEAARPLTEQETGRPEHQYERQPQGYDIGRPPPRLHTREHFDDKADKGKGSAEAERTHERDDREDIDDDDDYGDSLRAPGASVSPGAFNGWASAALYYHAIHRLPPLSVSTRCDKRGGRG